MNTTKHRVLALLAVVTLAIGFCARDVSAQGAANAKIDDADIIQAKKDALEWLTTYLHSSVLLDQKTIDQVRNTVLHMTPDQLRQWLRNTEQLRAYVQSDSWQATRRWLHQFLHVQAIYSDKELAEFRKKIESADPKQLMEIMQRIQAKQATMSWMHQASAVNKQAKLQAQKATLKANSKAAARRRPSSGSRPLFGSASPKAGKANSKSGSYKGYRVPGPLIDSREAARWSVFPRGGWYGW